MCDRKVATHGAIVALASESGIFEVAPSASASQLGFCGAPGQNTDPRSVNGECRVLPSSSSPNQPEPLLHGVLTAVEVDRQSKTSPTPQRFPCHPPPARRRSPPRAGRWRCTRPSHDGLARPPACGRSARARSAAADRTGGGSDTTRAAGPGARRSRSCARARRACRADPVVSSTASQSPPDIRSSTDVYLRNVASAAGRRERSSRRKYSETNRSSPLKPSPVSEPGAPVCIDSAARYRPAGQPSVRSVRSERWLASSSTPAASSNNPASSDPAGGPPRRSRGPARSSASGQAAAPVLPCSRPRSANRPEHTGKAPRAHRNRTDWLRDADHRARAPWDARSARAPPMRGTRFAQVDVPGPDNASNTLAETGSIR